MANEVWDSSDVFWDDPNVAWDGGDVVPATEPAFQSTAFPFQAFQAVPGLSIDVAQSIPAFTQSGDVFDGSAAPATQTIPAFTQTGFVFNGLAIVVEQNIPGFLTVGNALGFQEDAYQLDAFETGQTSNSQDIDATLTIRAKIGAQSGDFQPDAFQDDAFELAVSIPVEIPFPTQHAVVANVPGGQTFAPITQTIPAFTQDATGTIQSGIDVTQTMPLPSQSLTVFEMPAGAIAQTLPAFTQTAQATLILDQLGLIHQIIPMFRQSLRVGTDRWEEWPVATELEWPVSVDEEWLVRR